GNVTLNSATNTIASLGSFTATNLSLNDAGSLSVTGPVTSSGNITLSATSLDFAGSLSSANLSLTSTSSITESTGAISTGTLTGTASGNVTLNSATNTIASLGSFRAPNLLLADTGSLGIAGNVSIANLLSLQGITGGVTQSSGTLAAGTLAAIGTLGGNVSFGDANNAIGTLSGFTLASGDFALTDASALAVVGTVVANNVNLTASSLDLTGTVLAATSLDLTNTGTGGITLAGFASVGSGLTLNSNGTVSETGTLIAGTLTGNGSGGNVALTSAFNSISTLGSYTLASNTLSLTDQSTLTITGPVLANAASLIAPGLIESGVISTTSALLLDGANIIAINGTLNAGNTLALQSTGTVTEGSSATVAAGSLVSVGSLAGDLLLTNGVNNIGTLGNITLSGTNSFDLNDASALTVAGTVAAGIVGITSQSGLTVASGGLINANTATLSGAGLDILGSVAATSLLALLSPSANNITEASTGAISAGTLTSGGATDGAVYLDGTANNIGTLTGFSAAELRLFDGASLQVIGSVASTGDIILIDASTLALNTSLNAGPAGTVELVANNFNLGSGATIVAPTGQVIVAPYSASTLVDLGGTGAGALDISSSFLSAVSAVSLVVGTADYLTPKSYAANNITVAGNITLSPALELIAANSIGQTGTLSGSNITMSATSIGLGGVVDTTGTLALDATGALTDAGTLTVGTLDFKAGSFVETNAAGPITAGFVAGTATGPVALAGAFNQIGTLGGITVSGADFSLDNGTLLNITAPVSANNITIIDSAAGGIALAATGSLVAGTAGRISLTGDAMSAATGAALTAPGGTITLAPYTANLAIDLGGTASGLADFSTGLISGTQAKLLQIGTGGGSIVVDAGSIVSATDSTLALDGAGIFINGTLGAPNLVFTSTAGVSQASTGMLNVAQLSGTDSGGDVQLAGAGNQIGTLGGISVASTYALNINDATSLNVAGSVVADFVTLAAPTIDFTGNVTAASLLALDPAGGITQTSGSIITALLTSDNTTDGVVVLTDAGNQIAALGSFNAASLNLADSVALSVAGPVTLSGNGTLSAAGIDFAGSLSSANLSLASAGSISQTSGNISTGAL
ncbi:MAG TPA: hypothetical protein PLO16_05655, partial [Acidocella sp.]|nr:hypothetical protein [Acidocella sp.]